MDVSLFGGPKFQNWISGIEPLVNLKGLSSKDLRISLLARRHTRDGIHFRMCISSQRKVLRGFRRALRWRFRKISPHQFGLKYDLYTTYCIGHAHSSWRGVTFLSRDCHQWLPHSRGYHGMALRPRGGSPQGSVAASLDFGFLTQ